MNERERGGGKVTESVRDREREEEES